APEDAVAAHPGEGHGDAAVAHLAQTAPYGPGARRHDHRLDLLALLAGLVHHARLAAAHDVAQHRVAAVADLSQHAHHARHRHAQQHEHVRHQHEARLE